jgi:putative flippase GtrA
VLNSYLWNTIWTFREEYKRSAKEINGKRTIFIRFIVVSLIGWLINYLVFKFEFQNFQFADIVIGAKSIKTQELYQLILASAAAILWNFFANKLWTYKK